jgi:hypothetical protein
MFLKPSHAIQLEHGFPNIVYEHAFPAFPRDIGLISGCSQFLGFWNTGSAFGQHAPVCRRIATSKLGGGNAG